MDRFISDKVKNVLNEDYHFNIFKIIGSYMSFNKSYMAFIYWKTNEELEMITEDDKERIKNLFFDCFQGNSYFSNEILDVILYFDSDENVQKNYNGNYFYATH